MSFLSDKYNLQQVTGGKNTLMLDNANEPSVMVRVPKFRWCDVFPDGDNRVCEAFIVNGKEVDEIWISKYQNVIRDGRAYSVAGVDPAHTIDFDTARQACENKGKGWHLMTNAEWAAIAYWCRANGTIPHGNNCAGVDYDNRHEMGADAGMVWTRESEWNNRSYKNENGIWYFQGRTLTGTGPSTWNHDWTSAGIADLNGNVWEWVGGLRMKDGELQVIQDNNAAAAVDQSATSSLWRAINTSGNLVAPGSANTYKYDGVNAGDAQQDNHGIGGGLILNTQVTKPQYTGGSTDEYYGYSSNTFQLTPKTTGVEPHKTIQQLGLYPVDSDHQNDGLWVRNYGERLPLRGGTWDTAAGAGVFALHLTAHRRHVSWHVGFRAAFVAL